MNNHSFLKIIVIGDSGVGKTSFISQFVNGQFSTDYKATIGACLFTKTITYNDRVIDLQFWDTAGQERFQSLGGSFYRGADACILAFDLTNHNSFNDLDLWKSDYLLQIDYNYREKLPFIVIGTKSDKLQNRIVTRDEINEWCLKNSIPIENYFDTSAKQNDNIKDAIDAVVRLGLSLTYRQQIYTPGVISIANTTPTSSKCTC